MSEDTFDWEPYRVELDARNYVLPETMTRKNKAVATTDNFYAVVGRGSFSHGYLLVIPKVPISSFAEIKDSQVEEFEWFTSKMAKVVGKTYNAHIAVAEHGMCPCLPGGDKNFNHAHIHILPFDSRITESQFAAAANFALQRRTIGVKKVKIGDVELSHPHDISEVLRSAVSGGEPLENYIAEGKLAKIKDLQQLDMEPFVATARKAVASHGHYVYFKSPWASSSFFTVEDMQSQAAREIVYNAAHGITKYEVSSTNWQWQPNVHWDVMFQTMKDLSAFMPEVEKDTRAKSFGFRNAVALSASPR